MKELSKGKILSRHEISIEEVKLQRQIDNLIDKKVQMLLNEIKEKLRDNIKDHAIRKKHFKNYVTASVSVIQKELWDIQPTNYESKVFKKAYNETYLVEISRKIKKRGKDEGISVKTEYRDIGYDNGLWISAFLWL